MIKHLQKFYGLEGVLSSFDSYGYQNAGVLEIHQKSTLKKTNYLADTVLTTASAK